MFLLGDFNINIEHSSSRTSHAEDYLDMLSSMAIFPIITKPTRVATTSSTIIIITTLHNCQSTGPDGISSSFIKLASNQLSLPLTILFNFCEENGIFPDSLKISKVIPIYKSGPKENMSNYRPISLLPVLSKVFENLIYNRIFSFLKKHNILSSTQYGFRPNISPELAVLDVVSSCYHNISKNQFVGLIMLDLKKAFDSMSHEILLSKLEHYGIRSNALRLFSSYLYNRNKILSSNSSLLPIKYGVPQRSILGPLLFLLFINDLENSLDCSPRLFADDTCIIANASTAVDLETQLNLELRNIDKWTTANKLIINPSTTYALIIPPHSNTTFSSLNLIYKNAKIDIANSIKYLGIYIDNKLNFKIHIKMLENKLSRAVGILHKTKSFLPTYVLHKLYYAFITHLNFGLLIWSATPKSNLTKLVRIQNKAIRLLAGADWKTHVPPLFSKLNILSLNKLPTHVIAKFMHKHYLGKLPKNFNDYFTLVSSVRFARQITL